MSESTYTLYRGLVTTTSTTNPTTVFTAPTDGAVSVNNIVATNSGASSRVYTIWIANIPILQQVSLPANTTQFIDLSQIIYSGETIRISGSSTAEVYIHIAGNDVI